MGILNLEVSLSHKLLHGVDPKYLKQKILDGKSITIIDKDCKFYSSAIVTHFTNLLGVTKGLKERGSDEKVWCFIGDMTFETHIL